MATNKIIKDTPNQSVTAFFKNIFDEQTPKILQNLLRVLKEHGKAFTGRLTSVESLKKGFLASVRSDVRAKILNSHDVALCLVNESKKGSLVFGFVDTFTSKDGYAETCYHSFVVSADRSQIYDPYHECFLDYQDTDPEKWEPLGNVENVIKNYFGIVIPENLLYKLRSDMAAAGAQNLTEYLKKVILPSDEKTDLFISFLTIYRS